MVVLDQYAVGQVEAVIVAPAHPHRVFVQVAVARGGLAGIDDAGAAPFYGPHVAVGIAGDAAHALCMKFRAMRSARRMLPAEPSTRAMSSPGAERVSPSAGQGRVQQGQGSTRLNTAAGHVLSRQHSHRLGPQHAHTGNVRRDEQTRGGVVERSHPPTGQASIRL